jgi:thiamine-phosphate pyrophosphorylase
VTTLPRLYAITDRGLAGGLPHDAIVAALCRGGARLIQLREKQMADGALLEAALRAAAAARAGGARLVINDRADIAALAGADGVHVGDKDLPAAAARALIGPHGLLGISTHSVEEARRAAALPVDYVALGPIFGTTHAAAMRAPVGMEAVSRAAASLGKPLVAIGGITLANAADVVAAGATAVAVMGDLMSAPDIEARTAALVTRLESR